MITDTLIHQHVIINSKLNLNLCKVHRDHNSYKLVRQTIRLHSIREIYVHPVRDINRKYINLQSTFNSLLHVNLISK